MNHETQPLPLRWGILGAARIARKAVIGAIRASGGEIVAIGASTRERAEIFGCEFDIPKAFKGYQAVLDCEDVDAVYIPLANGLHFRWALECARAGKHCLCEKPLTLTSEEARQLREAFAQASRRLMEAFMWRHHPLSAWIERQLRAGEIGEPRRIHAAFSFLLERPEDFRWCDDQGGGALWDVGCYCVNAMRLFFGEEPNAVSARSHFIHSHSKTDRSTAGWLDFGQERMGTFECSLTSTYDQTLTLTGTEGLMRIERPFRGINQHSVARIQTGDKLTETPFDADNAYEHMVAHFARAAHDPTLALHPAEDGLAQSYVMEALVESAAHEGLPQIVSPF